MALPRELVDVMQLSGAASGTEAADGEAARGNLQAAAALVGDFASECASKNLDRLLSLCEAGDARGAAGMAAEACEQAALLDGEVRRFLSTAGRL